jgi:hypothetical protein
MKERPILFSAPMIRAILDGRKTQTRRIMKPQPDAVLDGEPYWHIGGYRTRIGAKRPFVCPYGQPGDRLWVRETCRAEELPSGLDSPETLGVRYLADDCFIPIGNTPESGDVWLDLRYYGKRASPVAPVKTVPAIHMPRWASRITLEITGIRVERLQDISESDALAEGIDPKFPPDEQWANAARMRFADIWESINGQGSWDTNPWVWVVEFRRSKK